MLLDPNTWSTDHTVSLGVWVPSWDGKKRVFAQKPNAADESTLYVLDVESAAVRRMDRGSGRHRAERHERPPRHLRFPFFRRS